METEITDKQNTPEGGSDAPTCSAPAKSWTKKKPTEPGAYWVKGFNLFVPARRQVEALVHIRKYRGKLICNLHESNSDNDFDDWSLIEDMGDFRWCGPLIPQNS